MVAIVLAACVTAFALLGGFLFVNSIIVFNTARYMAVAPSMLWRDTDYVRHFPNLLKLLYDEGFISPWPTKPTALAAYTFRRKLSRLLKDQLPDANRLIQQHLNLWAFVQLNREELQYFLRVRQMQRARRFMAESRDANVRGRLLVFLNQCKDAELLAARTNPPPASTEDTVHWLVRLRSFDILLREHGYQICDEISALDRWEGADEATILGELSIGVSEAMPLAPNA